MSAGCHRGPRGSPRITLLTPRTQPSSYEQGGSACSSFFGARGRRAGRGRREGPDPRRVFPRRSLRHRGRPRLVVSAARAAHVLEAESRRQWDRQRGRSSSGRGLEAQHRGEDREARPQRDRRRRRDRTRRVARAFELVGLDLVRSEPTRAAADDASARPPPTAGTCGSIRSTAKAPARSQTC